jgi:hypothetical protein
VRVLFIANEQPDFLQDLVFHGLVSLLGESNVIDCPPVTRYRLPPPAGATFPMLWFGLPPREPVPTLDALAGADAVVIASLRGRALDEARTVLGRRPGIPVAFVDGEDDPYVRAIVGRVDVYLKRETLAGGAVRRLLVPVRRLRDRRKDSRRDPLERQVELATVRSRRIVPLPFGIVDCGFVPAGETRFDVTFLGSLTSPERRELRSGLERLRAEGFRVCAQIEEERPLGWREYMAALAASRIGVSVRGLGFDTYRYWEIPYAGALLLAASPGTVVPENFEDGSEAVFAPAERLVDRARELLAGDTGAIARRGREKLLRAHTSVNRAQVVLDGLAGRL